MGKIKLMLGALALVISSQAQSAILNIDADGVLTGASNVLVWGSLYDVAFVDSLRTVGTFTTENEAAAASNALLEQVFLDGPDGDFDSLPGLTRSCDGDIGLDITCSIATPFYVIPEGQEFAGLMFAALAVNTSSSIDRVGGTTICVDPKGCEPPSVLLFRAFASWTYVSTPVPAVPVPAAVWLFGTGIIGLIGFSRRRKSA